MKYKIRGYLFLVTGLILSIGAFLAWRETGYLWGTKHSADGSVGSFHLVLIVIGLALIIGSFFEFVKGRKG